MAVSPRLSLGPPHGRRLQSQSVYEAIEDAKELIDVRAECAEADRGLVELGGAEEVLFGR